MREIKFRAWDKVEKEWLDIKHFGFDGRKLWYIQAIDENEKDIDPPYFADSDEIELMQCTGLKDKNGREIYEGDICRKRNTIGVVVWANEYQSLGFYLKSESGLHDVIAPYYMWDFEVIGNIHKNPELLEGDAH